MNFSYLLLVHKNPSQLHRLIRALDSDESIFIIHVDTKIAIRPFIKCFENYPPGKIFFCPDRKNVERANFSIIEATISLIRFLFHLGLKVDYVHLMNGQDYPVKSNEKIVEFLKQYNGKNFLDYYSIPDQSWPKNRINRIQSLCELNAEKSIYFNDLENKSQYQIFQTFPIGITPYGGSEWWTLHIECVRFLLDNCTEENNLYCFYQHTVFPNEMFFHTLIMNSSFKDTVVNDNLRYDEWKLNAAIPDIITIDYLEMLMSGEKLFARKSDSGWDNNVWGQLDIYRNNKNTSRKGIETFLEKLNPTMINNNWCVIAAVGKTSRHRKWLDENSKFDLHLIVYDNSYDEYKNDTKFVTQSKGYKFKLVYDYLNSNQQIIDKYDYFYIPDDDIDIDSENIHHLFEYMEEFKLSIAQPALTNSYYFFPHTAWRPNSVLRFTNFVEIMQPCFFKDALKKVLFTFNENSSGWGIDFHWGELIDYHKYNMAIIDDVISVHTRPLQSNHVNELNEYLLKYNLTMQIKEIK